MKTKPFRCYPDDVHVPPNRRRPLDQKRVDEIAKSISEIGLMTPIHVREGADADGIVGPVLVAGMHRHAALLSLERGGDLIDCIMIDCDEIDAEIWEIDENLQRSDLTEAQRREQLSARAVLTAKRIERDASLQSRHGGAIESKRADGRGHRHESGIKAAARELGVAETTVRRAVAAESLPEKVKAAADEAGLGTTARAAAAREPTPEAQAAKIAELAKERADRKLLHSAGDDLVKRDAADEGAIWAQDRAANDDDFRVFIGHLDACNHHKMANACRRELKTGERRSDRPVFDNTRAGSA